jgi:hypothetical protein
MVKESDQQTGSQSSFVFTGTEVLGLPDLIPVASGSSAGAPPPDAIVGTGGGGDGSATATGHAAASLPAGHQPVFWMVVLMAAGVAIMGHAAWISAKARL